MNWEGSRQCFQRFMRSMSAAFRVLALPMKMWPQWAFRLILRGAVLPAFLPPAHPAASSQGERNNPDPSIFQGRTSRRQNARSLQAGECARLRHRSPASVQNCNWPHHSVPSATVEWFLRGANIRIAFWIMVRRAQDCAQFSKHVTSFDAVFQAGNKTLLSLRQIGCEQERKQMQTIHVFCEHSAKLAARCVCSSMSQ